MMPAALTRRSLGLGLAVLAGVGVAIPAAAAPGRVGYDLPALCAWHRHYPGSRRWRLTAAGIELEDRGGVLAYGRDATGRAWSWFGPLIGRAAGEYGIPVELVLATLATESVGSASSAAQAARMRGTSGEVGIMQTLPATARAALGQPRLKAADLTDPLTSLRAGCAYIALQLGETGYDPPLVAAAYNAGGVRQDRAPRNRWRLACHPRGTGGHVEKFAGWFGDAMALSGSRPGQFASVPSFRRALAGG